MNIVLASYSDMQPPRVTGGVGGLGQGQWRRAVNHPKPITGENTQYSFIGTGAVPDQQQAEDGEERNACLDLNLSGGQRSQRSACISRCKGWSVLWCLETDGGAGNEATVGRPPTSPSALIPLPLPSPAASDVRVQLRLRLSRRDSRSPSRSDPCGRGRPGKRV